MKLLETIKANIEQLTKAKEKLRLENQLATARRDAVEDFKASWEFKKTAMEYGHNHLNAFITYEVGDDTRCKTFFHTLGTIFNGTTKKLKDPQDQGAYNTKK